MCLWYSDQFKSPKYGYKVVSPTNNPNKFDNSFWLGTEALFTTYTLGKKMNDSSHENIRFGFGFVNNDKYETGYHLFVLLRDAKKYVKNIKSSEEIEVVVVRCKFDEVTVKGIWRDMKTIVARQITPLKVVA